MAVNVPCLDNTSSCPSGCKSGVSCQRRWARWQRPAAMMLALGALAGLLWLKLRIVSGLPKTAYAVPQTPAPKPKPVEEAGSVASQKDGAGHQTAAVSEPGVE